MMSLVPDGNVAPDGIVQVVDTGAAPPVTAGGAYETARGTVVVTASAMSAGQVIDGWLTGGGGPPGPVGPPQLAASTSRTKQASV
jgi:hypothetical protein